MRHIKRVISFLLLTALILSSILPAYATTNYKYDSLGRLKEVSHISGKKVIYTYDVVGNITAVVSTAGQAKLTKIEFESVPEQLKVGETAGLTLKAVYSDGTSKTIDSGTEFSSSNELVATIDDTGKVSAISAGEATITAAYNSFTVSVKITVSDSQPILIPVITTTAGALAHGMVGTDYSVTIAAGNSPTAFTVSSGNLPEGLNIGNDGVISGTPTTAGTSNFSVTASNEAGTSAPVAFSIEIREAPGHNYIPVVTAPTCVEKGFTTYSCSHCGDSYIADYVDALGHIESEEGVVTTPPTYTEPGVRTYYCKVCNEALRTEDIAPLDPVDVKILSIDVQYSAPIYTGSGGNRTGSTTVTLDFILSDGNIITKTEPFTGIKETTGRTVAYNIINSEVSVQITVTVAGENNQMSIIGATARIEDDGTGDIRLSPADVKYSTPTYAGSGGNRVGSTTVTMDFTRPDGSKETKTELFTGINRTTDRTVTYEIDGYKVTVIITVTAIGSNNNMNITGATARIEKYMPIEPPDPNNVELLPDDVRYSTPSYTGNGGNRTGSTTVTMAFTRSDGSKENKTELFTGINGITDRTVTYEIDGYQVTVIITVTATGSNNSMTITGVTAKITSSVHMD